MYSMRWVAVGLAVCSALVAFERSASCQTLQSFALDRYEPTPAGDRFFAVEGADLGGHVTPRLQLLGDYAYRPLVLYRNDGDDRVGSLVSNQLFLHLGLSLGLWDRLLLSVNLPLALVTNGDSPESGGIQFSSPSGAAVGDLRLGARLRLLGEARGPVQLSLGGLVWLPTGDRKSYAGDGRARGRPELVLSGETSSFAYAVQSGIVIRRDRQVLDSETGSEFAFGAAVGVLLADRKLQIGPELYGTSTLKNAFERATTNAEAILGLRLRVSAFVLGIGAGPGLSKGVGTPSARGLLSLVYAPEPEAPPPVKTDRDKDGIWDDDDACPDDFGMPSTNPMRNGCPDRDKDKIFDQDDACVDVPGVEDEDPKKNGCPPDRDGDGIVDDEDACPDEKGVKDEDPKKNGCPPDRDGDGIIDDKDACPDVPGVKSSDPEKNGCPGDKDGDGITDDKDACPNEKGKPDPDPKKNGCPTLVRVTAKEIVILQQVQFKTGSDVILPASDELLEQVSAVLREHPEIKKIEVQGHTDNRGAAAYNKNLSQRRARSVTNWLVKRGHVEESRLEAKGYGMDQPVAENSTDEGRQLNRRVQFKIVDFERPGADSQE
jgi:OOP family OmpA-OmpF porin